MRILSFEISAKYLKALLFEQGAFPFSKPVYTRDEDTTSIREEGKPVNTLHYPVTPVDVDKQWKIIRLLKTEKYNTHVLRHIFSIVFLAMALH